MRDILQSDIDSATRGLRLDVRTTSRILDTLHDHEHGDYAHLFASKVIAVACRQQLALRRDKLFQPRMY